MTYIPEINQVAAPDNAKFLASAEEQNDVMGKQDFLTLLVAQLQNQDPMNPDDPTEFTAQLAQFSSLEQLFNLNESMDNMATSQANSQQLTALSLIGKDVTFEGNSVHFDGQQPVDVGYKLDGQAKDVTLYLQSPGGATVATLRGDQLNTGNHFMTWDGTDQDGNIMPPGDYRIILQATAIEGTTIEASPLVQAEVTGVDLSGTEGGLLYTSSGEVYLNNIFGVYEQKDPPPEENEDPESFTESETESEESIIEEVATGIVAEIMDENPAPTDDGQTAQGQI